MGTNTTKHNLYKPTVDETGWGNTVNANCDVIDTLPYMKKGVDVVAEAALFTAAGYPADGNYFDITGPIGITSIITSGVIGTMMTLHFDEDVLITHNTGSLELPRERNITTSIGEELIFVEFSSGNWRCIGGNLLSITFMRSIVCHNNQVVCHNNEVVIL